MERISLRRLFGAMGLLVAWTALPEILESVARREREALLFPCPDGSRVLVVPLGPER